MSGATAPSWSLRPAAQADVERIAELKAQVLRADLERLGRFDAHRVRQRARDEFAAGYTSLIEAGDGSFAGSVTFRPAGPGEWALGHFYLAPEFQGRGLGSAVLGALLARADAAGVAVRLTVLAGSAACRLYERHGFTVVGRDAIDVFMVRRPAG